MTTTTRTEALRRLAEKATPGPWRFDGRVGEVTVYAGEPRNCLAAPNEWFVHVKNGKWVDDHWTVDERDEADAAYIAALSPDVVSLLLDVVEAARATGWNERDGRCWCPQSRENTGFDLHGSRCAALRAALDRLDS